MKSINRQGLSYFVGGLLCVIAMLISLPVEGAEKQQFKKFFEDKFNGNTIDSSIWNTTMSTSGNRFCFDSFTPPDYPGMWLDVSVESCYNAGGSFPYTETPPFGNIEVHGGTASFTSSYKRAFPYIWSGPPSRLSPFPASGNFILEIKMKFDKIQPGATGVEVQYWANSEPVGNNSPVNYPYDFVLEINAATAVSLDVWLLTQDVIVDYPLDYHIYRVEYIDGAYSLYIDDILRIGPVPSSIRPNSIWMGLPGISSPINWSHFTVDYIKVLQ